MIVEIADLFTDVFWGLVLGYCGWSGSIFYALLLILPQFIEHPIRDQYIKNKYLISADFVTLKFIEELKSFHKKLRLIIIHPHPKILEISNNTLPLTLCHFPKSKLPLNKCFNIFNGNIDSVSR